MLIKDRLFVGWFPVDSLLRIVKTPTWVWFEIGPVMIGVRYRRIGTLLSECTFACDDDPPRDAPR